MMRLTMRYGFPTYVEDGEDGPKNETLAEHKLHCKAKPNNCPFERKAANKAEKEDEVDESKSKLDYATANAQRFLERQGCEIISGPTKGGISLIAKDKDGMIHFVRTQRYDMVIPDHMKKGKERAEETSGFLSSFEKNSGKPMVDIPEEANEAFSNDAKEWLKKNDWKGKYCAEKIDVYGFPQQEQKPVIHSVRGRKLDMVLPSEPKWFLLLLDTYKKAPKEHLPKNGDDLVSCLKENASADKWYGDFDDERFESDFYDTVSSIPKEGRDRLANWYNYVKESRRKWYDFTFRHFDRTKEDLDVMDSPENQKEYARLKKRYERSCVEFSNLYDAYKTGRF